MDIQIIDSPICFNLHGLSSEVENEQYGPTGLRLMDAMWKVVKASGLGTTGINHWVYLPDGRMFVGVEVTDPDRARVPEPLEPCEFELPRSLKHVHIGPYQTLPQKWAALKSEIADRGESIGFPSLEIYSHASCDGTTEPETTILLGLKRTGP
ncbi:hypothetical protein [Planctellipticum variicoloris]|uniref:hypothetical protein n=1 Tax=Planctellipticum variicoloris TaxID=3064265 RepID=UPI0030135E20|nr:hypothetical protein SH412_003097 [Planctomycetaceae bacterium SH412]